MDLIAHRGWAARYPENTVPAFRAALEAGARFVELDVQLSSDLVPVVFHGSRGQRHHANRAGIGGLMGLHLFQQLLKRVFQMGFIVDDERILTE